MLHKEDICKRKNAEILNLERMEKGKPYKH